MDKGERGFEAQARMWLGKILGQSQPERVCEAEQFILDGISGCEELGVKAYVVRGHLYLGELYAHTGQKKKALQHLRKAREMASAMGIDYSLEVAEDVLRLVE